MQGEHDAYLKASDMLKTMGYETPNKIKSLEQIKSNFEDCLSINNVETRYIRKEIRFCNTALELNNHIEKKIRGLDEIGKCDEQKRMTAKELARNLLKR